MSDEEKTVAPQDTNTDNKGKDDRPSQPLDVESEATGEDTKEMLKSKLTDLVDTLQINPVEEVQSGETEAGLHFAGEITPISGNIIADKPSTEQTPSSEGPDSKSPPKDTDTAMKTPAESEYFQQTLKRYVSCEPKKLLEEAETSDTYVVKPDLSKSVSAPELSKSPGETQRDAESEGIQHLQTMEKKQFVEETSGTPASSTIEVDTIVATDPVVESQPNPEAESDLENVHSVQAMEADAKQEYVAKPSPPLPSETESLSKSDTKSEAQSSDSPSLKLHIEERDKQQETSDVAPKQLRSPSKLSEIIVQFMSKPEEAPASSDAKQAESGNSDEKL